MSEKIALAQPKFIKVKDIEHARSGYNVYVKIVSAEVREIETREGKKIPMVDAVVADETASAKAFFKGDTAALIQKDSVVAIRNGVKRFVKDHISLEIDLFGRVTLEKAVTIASTSSNNISDVEHKLTDRPRRPRRDNRPNETRRDNRRADDRREERPGREERPRREGRQDRPRHEDREERPRRDNREPRREEDRPRKEEERPRRNENRREEGDYKRRPNRNNEDRPRNNDRDYERRDNRDNRDDRRERRNDRDYDRTDRADNYRSDNRPPRQYQEKREENRERRAPLQWNKIVDITPGEDRLNITAKVVSAQKVGSRIRCVLGDETGITNAFLPDSEFLYEGETIVLFNARSEVVKEHIQIQLDKRGRIEKSRRDVPKVSEEYNLSLKAWIPIE